MTYKEMYEDLFNLVDSSMAILQQSLDKLRDTYITEEKKEMWIYHYNDEGECHPDK